MCSRFVLETPIANLGQYFGFIDRPNLAPRFNIAPTQDIVVIQDSSLAASVETVSWGLTAQTKNGKRLIINARSETVSSLLLFKKAFLYSRCLILADGYYEWKAEGKHKLPSYISKQDSSVMAFAGLTFAREPEYLDTKCAVILTVASNNDLCQLHDRMPLILAADQWQAWLSPHTSYQTLPRMLRSLPDGQLIVRKVSSLINNSRYEATAIPFL